MSQYPIYLSTCLRRKLAICVACCSLNINRHKTEPALHLLSRPVALSVLFSPFKPVCLSALFRCPPTVMPPNLPINHFVRKKVAIVGSGSAGMAALWALNRTYHDVYLFEAADRLGGHTNTVQWKSGKYSTAVDTGFIVFNTATYRMWQLSKSQNPGSLALCSRVWQRIS